MNDFIFGTLATGELRLAHLRRRRGGLTHRSARQPLDPLPGQPVTLSLTAGPACLARQSWVYWTCNGSEPQGQGGQAFTGRAAPLERVGESWDTLEWGYVRTFRGVLPAQPAGTVVRYKLGAATDEGEILADDGTAYAYYVDDDPLPEWARDAIVYQVFVDRFHPGAGRDWQQPGTPAGFYGGTLRGITENLAFITRLGATALWLTPIFPSPSHHGYDTTDFFGVEPRLGTQDDLRALLEAAHGRGLRVLLDFVPNHCSNLHPAFQAAQASPDDPHAGWFSFCRWPDEYQTFFGVKALPQLNLRHPAARRHLLEAAVYWLEFGVDGFRLDYAIGPSPDFWADFRRATRAARPDCWTFGEVVEPSDSQAAFTGLLDGCLDFILLEGLRQAFAFGQWPAARLADFLDRHEAFFPPGFSRPSFLDNHDMNRFLWAAGGDQRRLKLAALCQFTLAGPPVVYYGTEVGLSQLRDVRQDDRGLPEEARLPMPWNELQDAALLAYYRALTTLRRRNPCLRRGTRRTVFASQAVLAYTRQYEGQTLLAAFNLSDQPQALSLPGHWQEILLATSGQASLPGGAPEGTRLFLPPLGGAVLR